SGTVLAVDGDLLDITSDAGTHFAAIQNINAGDYPINTMDINQDGVDDGTVHDLFQFVFSAEDISKVDKVIVGFLLDPDSSTPEKINNYYFQEWTSGDFSNSNNPIVLAEHREGFKRVGANLD